MFLSLIGILLSIFGTVKSKKSSYNAMTSHVQNTFLKLERAATLVVSVRLVIPKGQDDCLRSVKGKFWHSLSPSSHVDNVTEHNTM